MAMKQATIVAEYEVVQDDFLEVHQVTVDGEVADGVADQLQLGSSRKEVYWPIIDTGDWYLDLHLIKA